MFFNFVGVWLIIALLLFAFSQLILHIFLPFWLVIIGGTLIGFVSFVISASYHKTYFAKLTDKILEKKPSLSVSDSENIYQSLSETITSLINHDTEVNERLNQKIETIYKLKCEIATNKLDQDEQIDAISNLYEEIVSLYEIGNQLGSIIDLNQLLKTIVKLATDTIGTETGILMLVNEEKNVLEIHEQKGYPEGKLPAQVPLDDGIIVKVIEHKSSIIISDLTSDPQYIHYRRFGFETESCLITPLLLKEKVIGLVFLGNKLKHDFFTAGNEKMLTALCNQAAIFIDNVRLFEETLAQHRLQQQLKIAHDIQTSLLPSKPPEIPGFDIYGFSIPAVDVGGDYFDYIKLKDGRWGVVVGDVSGKGVPAALLMTTTRSMFRSQAYYEKQTSNMLAKLNDQLAQEDIPDRFVTMLYAILEPNSHEINLSCAGHDPMLVYHEAENNFQEYHPRGLVLGIMAKQKYRELKINLNSGDVALIYTDGITEALNTQNEQFGLQRLKDIIEKKHELSAKRIADEVLNTIQQFSHDCAQHDDITLMVVKSL